MIPNGEGWHYLAVKNIYISGLLRRIISNYVESFFVWIVFIPLKQKTSLIYIKKYAKIKISKMLWCFLKTIRH